MVVIINKQKVIKAKKKCELAKMYEKIIRTWSYGRNKQRIYRVFILQEQGQNVNTNEHDYTPRPHHRSSNT
jgi:hypothetical protein